MLSKFSIKKPLTIVVIIIIIIILGVVSYMGMQEDLLPDMNLPYLIVVTIYPGAQPDVVEQEVTMPLEESFASVSNINRLNSVSSEHYSMIIMELSSGADVDVAKNNLQDAITFASLPKNDMLQDPIIIKLDPSMLPIMRVSVGYDTESNDDRTTYLDNVIEKIGAVDGVASVTKSGLVASYAYLNTNSEKTAKFFTEALADKLEVDIHLPEETKDRIRTELNTIVTDAKTNPDLQTDEKIDPEKVLDALIDRMEDFDSSSDAVNSLINNYLIGQLKNEGAIRDTAIGLVDEAVENSYILEDGEENKLIFNSVLDEFTDTSVVGMVQGMLGSTLSMLTEDLYKQLIYAQDMNYPAGSVDKGAASFVVKVGDTIGKREDFMNLPVFTVDIADTLQEYLNRLEMILRLFSAATEDGKVTITDEQLKTLAEYLSYMAERVDDYGEWVVNTVTSESRYSPYYMEEEGRTAWKELLNSEFKDAEGTERNELFDLVASWNGEPPYNWRTLVLSCVKDNKLYPTGAKISGEVIWDAGYTEHYIEAIRNKYNDLSDDKPEEDDVAAYADYVISQTVISDENKTVWRELLIDENTTVFADMVTAVGASDTSDWQLCALKCVINNNLYPASWDFATKTAIKENLNVAVNAKKMGHPSTAEEYARLAVYGVVPTNPYFDFYLDKDAKDKWISKICGSADFVTLVGTITEDDDYMLMVYRFLSENTESENPEDLLFPVEEVMKEERFWGESDDKLFGTFVDTLTVRFTAAEEAGQRIIEAIGEDNYNTLIDIFSGRTAEENYDMLIDVLGVLDRFAGDDAVTETVDGETGEKSYVIDLRLINDALENSGDKLKITTHLTNLCEITFIDDLSKQITKLILGIPDGETSVENSIQLSIDKEPTAASAEVTDGVKKVLADLAKKDEKFSYTVLSDDGLIIGFMLNSVLTSLLIGGLLALLILIFFLKDIKATLVIGSSILISVVVAVVLMYFTGISLNVISLGGLTLGVGMLVDNSVVVLENTYRLRSKGYSVMQAAVQGAKQMLPAILGSTITTVVVFLPIVFVEGLVKEIFVDFALTICYSLIASLFVSMTVVPAAYNTFMAPRPIVNPDSKWGKFRMSKFGKLLVSDGTQNDGKFAVKFKKGYVKALDFVLNHKVIAIILVVILFAGSVFAAFSVGTEYFPDTYMGYIAVEAEINPDAIDKRNAGLTYENDDYFTYEDAEQEVVEKLIDVFSEYPDIEAVGISRAAGLNVGGMNLGAGTITATVTLVEEKHRSMNARDFVNELSYAIERKSNNLFTATVDMYSLSSMIDLGAGKTNVYVYGNDYSEIQEETKLLAEKFGEIEGVYSVFNGIEEKDKEYRVVVDKDKANLYGLTVGQVYLQVSSALGVPSAIHDLTLAAGDGQEKMSVLVFNSSYLSKYWYAGIDEKGKATRVYFRNNASEEGASDFNEYYVKSPFKDPVYVKTADGKAVTVPAKGNIPVVREGNNVSFDYAVVTEKEDGTHDINYSKRTYEFSDEVKYYTNLRDDLDLVTMPITSENMLNPSAPKVSIPLYKILSDECLLTDAEGNVLYRQSATDLKIPVGIKLSDGYTSINHIQYRKCVTMEVSYDEKISSNKMISAINEVITEYNKTKPSAIEATTESTGGIMDNVFENLYTILILAIVLVFLVMVAQFQSWKSPFIIMGTIVLAFTGSFYLMAMTGVKVGIMSLIGLIVLMGVVVNNGIVFVDYTNSLIESGMEKRKALLKAGNDRIRPILMTAITTVLGMLAMACDGSDYGAMLQPLAIAMVGGLAYATVMTLFIVPALYDLLNRKTGKRAERAIAFKNTDLDFTEEDSSDISVMDEYITGVAVSSAARMAERAENRRLKKQEKKGLNESAESRAEAAVDEENKPSEEAEVKDGNESATGREEASFDEANEPSEEVERNNENETEEEKPSAE